MKWKFTSISLRTKLKLFMFFMLVPMICMVIFLIIKLSTYTDKYTPIVNDVMIASEFDMRFKEQIDYTMYRIAIGSDEYEDSNIEQILKEMDDYLEQLKEGTSLESNKKQVRMAQRNLTILEKSIYKLIDNCKETGHYDENMIILDNDIYVLTKLITEEIREYMYYEALELEKVRKAVEADIDTTLKVIFCILLVVLGITWLLVIVISDSISKPIMHLCEITKQVGTGNFTMQKIKGGGDEIATLESSFNNMLVKINKLVDNIKSKQNTLRMAELKLLQAQINPHFLYNTLDTITWMAEDGKSDEVVDLVSALSEFFRVSLSKGRDYITLKEEESHIRSYLQIQQFRYADILEYEINIPQELSEFPVLKLTLQPIVENALYHGIKQKREKGKIIVEGEYSNQAILLTVKDNGIGMTEETLDKMRRSIKKEGPITLDTGFGLANVNERIRLNYGKEYGLRIESEYNVGTTITVHLPMKSLENDLKEKEINPKII